MPSRRALKARARARLRDARAVAIARLQQRPHAPEAARGAGVAGVARAHGHVRGSEAAGAAARADEARRSVHRARDVALQPHPPGGAPLARRAGPRPDRCRRAIAREGAAGAVVAEADARARQPGSEGARPLTGRAPVGRRAGADPAAVHAVVARPVARAGAGTCAARAQLCARGGVVARQALRAARPRPHADARLLQALALPRAVHPVVARAVPRAHHARRVQQPRARAAAVGQIVPGGACAAGRRAPLGVARAQPRALQTAVAGAVAGAQAAPDPRAPASAAGAVVAGEALGAVRHRVPVSRCRAGGAPAHVRQGVALPVAAAGARAVVAPRARHSAEGAQPAFQTAQARLPGPVAQLRVGDTLAAAIRTTRPVAAAQQPPGLRALPVTCAPCPSCRTCAAPVAHGGLVAHPVAAAGVHPAPNALRAAPGGRPAAVAHTLPPGHAAVVAHQVTRRPVPALRARVARGPGPCGLAHARGPSSARAVARTHGRTVARAARAPLLARRPPERRGARARDAPVGEGLAGAVAAAGAGPAARALEGAGGPTEARQALAAGQPVVADPAALARRRPSAGHAAGRAGPACVAQAPGGGLRAVQAQAVPRAHGPLLRVGARARHLAARALQPQAAAPRRALRTGRLARRAAEARIAEARPLVAPAPPGADRAVAAARAEGPAVRPGVAGGALGARGAAPVPALRVPVAVARAVREADAPAAAGERSAAGALRRTGRTAPAPVARAPARTRASGGAGAMAVAVGAGDAADRARPARLALVAQRPGPEPARGIVGARARGGPGSGGHAAAVAAADALGPDGADGGAQRTDKPGGTDAGTVARQPVPARPVPTARQSGGAGARGLALGPIVPRPARLAARTRPEPADGVCVASARAVALHPIPAVPVAVARGHGPARALLRAGACVVSGEALTAGGAGEVASLRVACARACAAPGHALRARAVAAAGAAGPAGALRRALRPVVPALAVRAERPREVAARGAGAAHAERHANAFAVAAANAIRGVHGAAVGALQPKPPLGTAPARGRRPVPGLGAVRARARGVRAADPVAVAGGRSTARALASAGRTAPSGVTRALALPVQPQTAAAVGTAGPKAPVGAWHVTSGAHKARAADARLRDRLPMHAHAAAVGAVPAWPAGRARVAAPAPVACALAQGPAGAVAVAGHSWRPHARHRTVGPRVPGHTRARPLGVAGALRWAPAHGASDVLGTGGRAAGPPVPDVACAGPRGGQALPVAAAGARGSARALHVAGHASPSGVAGAVSGAVGMRVALAMAAAGATCAPHALPAAVRPPEPGVAARHTVHRRELADGAAVPPGAGGADAVDALPRAATHPARPGVNGAAQGTGGAGPPLGARRAPGPAPVPPSVAGRADAQRRGGVAQAAAPAHGAVEQPGALQRARNARPPGVARARPVPRAPVGTAAVAAAAAALGPARARSRALRPVVVGLAGRARGPGEEPVRRVAEARARGAAGARDARARRAADQPLVRGAHPLALRALVPGVAPAPPSAGAAPVARAPAQAQHGGTPGARAVARGPEVPDLAALARVPGPPPNHRRLCALAAPRAQAAVAAGAVAVAGITRPARALLRAAAREVARPALLARQPREVPLRGPGDARARAVARQPLAARAVAIARVAGAARARPPAAPAVVPGAAGPARAPLPVAARGVLVAVAIAGAGADPVP